MKKGFTLVELIISLSILLLITTISTLGFRGFSSIKSSLKVKEFIYEINDGITYGRLYCIDNNLRGKFVIVESEGNSYLRLENASGVINEVKLESALTIDRNENATFSINIESDGKLESKTLYLRDKDNNKYKLSITPIVFLVNIKKV